MGEASALSRKPLFAITAAWHGLELELEALTADGGELASPEVAAAFDRAFADVAEAEADKLAGFGSAMDQWEMEKAALEARIKELTAKRNRLAALIDGGKSRVLAHLEATGRTRATAADGRTFAVQFNGGKVPVVLAPDLDPAALPDDVCRVRREVDREAVRARLEAGEAVPGCRLGERTKRLAVRV